MSEQHISTWKSKINALGPGIMMASAAVGGSHLIASTQAGALYGWQIALIIILTNLFKYPFFRFSAHYTLDTGKSLIEGYAEKSRVYLWVFLILCILSATINAGAVAIVTAAIVKMAIPSLMFDAGTVAALIMAFLPDYFGERTLPRFGSRFQNHHRYFEYRHACRRRHRYVARYADAVRFYRADTVDACRFGLPDRADGLDARAD